jgi:hypothetical protein
MDEYSTLYKENPRAARKLAAANMQAVLDNLRPGMFVVRPTGRDYRITLRHDHPRRARLYGVNTINQKEA